jgi:hypothetical protein
MQLSNSSWDQETCKKTHVPLVANGKEGRKLEAESVPHSCVLVRGKRRPSYVHSPPPHFSPNREWFFYEWWVLHLLLFSQVACFSRQNLNVTINFIHGQSEYDVVRRGSTTWEVASRPWLTKPSVNHSMSLHRRSYL